MSFSVINVGKLITGMRTQIKKALKQMFVYDVVQFVHRRRIARTENERKREEIELWEIEGRPVPPPPSFKQKIVMEYGTKFAIKILVETGTYLGEMIEAIRRKFKRIYSIELDNALFEKARKKFEKYKHISLYKGDSSEVLSELLASIDKPALFWLDAHYSAGITAKGDLETPIMQELASIFSHKISNHVILIDDARCFTGKLDYPTLSQLKQFVFENRPDLLFEVKDDIIRIHD